MNSRHGQTSAPWSAAHMRCQRTMGHVVRRPTQTQAGRWKRRRRRRRSVKQAPASPGTLQRTSILHRERTVGVRAVATCAAGHIECRISRLPRLRPPALASPSASPWQAHRRRSETLRRRTAQRHLTRPTDEYDLKVVKLPVDALPKNGKTWLRYRDDDRRRRKNQTSNTHAHTYIHVTSSKRTTVADYYYLYIYFTFTLINEKKKSRLTDTKRKEEKKKKNKDSKRWSEVSSKNGKIHFI